MLFHIISFIILLISIDVYYILYKKYKTLFLKRQNNIERQLGMSEEELSTYEDVTSPLPTIVYALAVIIGGVYFNFINKDIFEGSTSFFSILFTNFEIVLLALFAFLSVSVLIKYIKDIISFFIAFKNNLVKSKKGENSSLDDLEENDEN